MQSREEEKSKVNQIQTAHQTTMIKTCQVSIANGIQGMMRLASSTATCLFPPGLHTGAQLN